MEIHPDFRDLLADFARWKVRYMLVGGYAVSFHSRPRFTKDMDLWVAPDAENLTRVRGALSDFGAPSEIVAAVDSWEDDEILYMGAPPVRIDLLKTIPGLLFDEAFPRAVDADWDGVPLRVVGLADLIAAKRTSARPQDLRDAAALERERGR